MTTYGASLWPHRPGSVQATVNNVFENSNATQNSIEQAIEEAIQKSNGTNELLAAATFNSMYITHTLPYVSKVQFGWGRSWIVCDVSFIFVSACYD